MNDHIVSKNWELVPRQDVPEGMKVMKRKQYILTRKVLKYQQNTAPGIVHNTRCCLPHCMDLQTADADRTQHHQGGVNFIVSVSEEGDSLDAADKGDEGK
jgi:hypothetical protein